MLHGFFAFWVVAWCRFALSPVGWAWLFKLKSNHRDWITRSARYDVNVTEVVIVGSVGRGIGAVPAVVARL